MENTDYSSMILVRPALWLTALFLLSSPAANAADDPLCPTPPQVDTIKELKRTSPAMTPAQIALQTRLSEAAVVHAMDLDSRIPVSIRDFEPLWEQMRRWEAVRLVVFSSGSTFEVNGELPIAGTEAGYFTFSSGDASFGGRLRRDRFGIIYLLTTPGQLGPVYEVVVFDRAGDRVFSVAVPRDRNGRILQQAFREFRLLENRYSGRTTDCNGRS